MTPPIRKHYLMTSTFRVAALLAALVTILIPSRAARADIFQWEYINPANPGLGKQQSATLAPDGAGVFLGDGVSLANLDLTRAYLIGALLFPSFVCDEAECYAYFPDLTGTTLAQADLTSASLQGAILTDADFTGAEVRGATFVRYSSQSVAAGMKASQLYSTASYQAQNLGGIRLYGHNFAGVNLVGQNLTGAALEFTNLTNADFSHANLTNARFTESTLSSANLSNAEVRGAFLSNITAAQLYSTASYQANDLTGINLDRQSLAGANFAGQNLTRASFYGTALANANFQQANLYRASFTYPLGFFPLFGQAVADLTGANLSLANLTNARFGGGEECSGEFCWYFQGANLDFANLSGADARDAYFVGASMIGTNTENMIQMSGHIAGLDLSSGEMLIVRNYVSLGAPVPIVVDQSLAMDAGSTLRLEFDADPWGSTISFAPGILLTLGGTLDLAFAADVNIASQLGRTIVLFNWTGVTPTGAFTISSPYAWDVSQLYTTGEVTLTGAEGSIPGDFTGDGVVDAADLADWKGDFGVNGASDADGDSDSDGADFLAWQRHLGQGSPGVAPSTAVPEPASFALLVIGAISFANRHSRRCRYNRDAHGVSSTQWGGTL
jgi:uncharacterized protein YjbI with pentapeptide repeats